MPKNKTPKNFNAKGFDTNKNDHIHELAEQYVKQREWEKAINAFSSLRPASKKELEYLIAQSLQEGVKAAEILDDKKALEWHCKLLGLDNYHATGLRNFALLLKRNGQYSDAYKYVMRGLELEPDCPDALNTLGTILADMGKHTEAINALTKSLKLNPNASNANNNLANQYHLNAQIDKAFIHSSRAIFYDSMRPALWIDHLTHLRRVCDFDRIEQVDWWEVLNAMPASWTSTSFLQVLTLGEREDQQRLLRTTIERWGDAQLQQADEHPIEKFEKPALSTNEPLRIGFISADFRDHSVARFIWPLFEHLDRNEFALYCYSTFDVKDDWRKGFESNSKCFRSVSSLSPQQLSEVIRSDGIHVLFELSGFTNGSRTGALAWRTAPVQVSWLGFPGTSGLKTIDYLFLDKYLTPSDPELIAEKPLLTRGTTVCFPEIAPIPITSIIPEKKRGFLTFGSLNNTYKMTRNTIQRWATILNEIPESQFLLVRREFESHLLRENILKEFERVGIYRGRIHFYNNRLDNRHYLDCYNEIDITLDTYPVTGGTTTTDALWMGVPVVALEGPNIHQRVCSAILRHAGHPEWIARNDDEFTQIALNLAHNQKLREDLRHSLRKEIKKSPLCDTKQFVKDFGDCMRAVRQSIS